MCGTASAEQKPLLVPLKFDPQGSEGFPNGPLPSSALERHIEFVIEDGKLDTRWASDWSDPQWLKVDLGNEQAIRRVVLRWEAAYGKSYRVEVSRDGTSWQQVYATTVGNGGEDVIRFPAVQARFVRVTGTQRATSYGYSLYEVEVLRQ